MSLKKNRAQEILYDKAGLIYTEHPKVIEAMERYAQQRVNDQWVNVKERLPDGSNDNEVEVIGFNEKWIHPDFNPMGQRICCKDDFGWYSARWNASHDCYIDVGPYENDNPTHWRPLAQSPKKQS